MQLKTVIIIILAILATGIFFFSKKATTKNSPAQTSADTITTNTDESLGLVMVPEGWKLYSDSKNGFRLNYPDNLKPDKGGEYNVLFSPNEILGDNKQFSYFYVSSVPKEMEKSETIYNYRYEDIAKLEKLAVNESVTLTENREKDEWYKYTRLPDKEISGKSSMQFLNEKPWEFLPETKEVKYIVREGDNLYILGAYYPNDHKILSEDTINGMLTSFNLTTQGQEILE